jgi:hypothetical protein
MYVSNVDSMIDETIDDFYVYLKDNKMVKKIIDETNFVKYQKELNNVLDEYSKGIRVDDLRDVLKNEDNVKIMVNIIKRYISLYLFMHIGVKYAGKFDTFVNNVVEFSKNQSGYSFKVSNFFTSENNAIVINNCNVVKNILTIIKLEQSKWQSLALRPEYKLTFEILNELGLDFIKEAFLKHDENIQVHNLIKTIIILMVYKKKDKSDIFKIIESASNTDEEYIFIDIVVPKTAQIDFSALENLLTPEELKQGFAHVYWDFINGENDVVIKKINIDEKVEQLIQSKILTPIVENFMMCNKDGEQYETNVDAGKHSKKDNTKIRYIINKIESVTEYYSPIVQNDSKAKLSVEKLFYAPLADKMAVAHNNNEDMKILNKLMNQGKKSIENNEYYNELLHYRKSPYINFKDFKNDGFSITLTQSSNVIRHVSFLKINRNRPIQTHMSIRDSQIHIIGFAIPSNQWALECLKGSEMIDIKSLSEETKNGFDLCQDYIISSNFNKKKHDSSIYWLFDKYQDKVRQDLYVQTDEQESFKIMIAKMYENLLMSVYDKFKAKFESKNKIHLKNGLDALEKFTRKIFDISDNTLLVNNIVKLIYDNIKTIEPKYDENDDKFYGLYGKVTKLKELPNKEKPKIQTISIDINKVVAKNEKEEEEPIEGMCQHNITWEKVSELRKTNPNAYGNMLFDFMEQYVIENADQDFLCKSCGGLLSIKKFISDGMFDNSTQRFITFSSPFDKPLEELPEYNKFKIAIRNIGQAIEKIASISGIPNFVGQSTTFKNKRKMLTKDVIDLIILNNAKLKPVYKERNNQTHKLYGVNNELTNLFSFELEDPIFVYSSKGKDHYKHIKFNNVLAYIMILMILEINSSHIGFMYGDKKGYCNYHLFERFGYSLFDGLKIIRNKSGDTVDIKNYKPLCYVLYLISCFMTKYNMWHNLYEEKVESQDSQQKVEKKEQNENESKGEVDLRSLVVKKSTQKKKIDARVHRTIIHTFVDVLNSILEYDEDYSKNRVYDIFMAKYIVGLTQIYNDDSVLNILKGDLKHTGTDEGKEFILSKTDPIKLSGKFVPVDFGYPHYTKCMAKILTIPKRQEKLKLYKSSNNITNCWDGKFHKWEIKDKIVCSLCNEQMTTLFDQKKTENIQKSMQIISLNTLAQKYCVDGSAHNFVISFETKEKKCEKCNFDKNTFFSEKQLFKLQENLEKNRAQISIDQAHTLKNNTSSNVDTELSTEFATIKSYDKIVDKIVDLLKNIIGSVNIGDSTTTLKMNKYSIDHDHHGNKLQKPLIISEDDNRMMFKNNHPFFKTDVLYYSSHKVDVFYNVVTHLMIGYKETNKDFTIVNNLNLKIKINYSIKNKLKLLGFTRTFVNITEEYKKKQDTEIQHDPSIINAYQEIIIDVVRERIHNLKKCIYEIQRIINKLKSLNPDKQFVKKNDEQVDMYSEPTIYDKIGELLVTYGKKIREMNLQNQKTKKNIFSEWKSVSNNTFVDVENILDMNINTDNRLINVNDVNDCDKGGNMLIFYICDQFISLMVNPQNKAYITNIALFIIDLVNILFSMFNVDDVMEMYDVKRFSHKIKNIQFIYDLNNMNDSYEVNDTNYEASDKFQSDEAKENIENVNTDLREEADALDLDIDREGDPDSHDEAYGELYENIVESD